MRAGPTCPDRLLSIPLSYLCPSVCPSTHSPHADDPSQGQQRGASPSLPSPFPPSPVFPFRPPSLCEQPLSHGAKQPTAPQPGACAGERKEKCSQMLGIGFGSSHSRTPSLGRSHLPWLGAPPSAHRLLSPSLLLGPPAPAHLASPRRRVGCAVAPQLRELTPQVWEPHGDLLSGDCGCGLVPQRVPGGGGKGRLGRRHARVTAS